MHFPAKLIDALCAASHVTVLTGAGVSAESGVPTFRDAQSGLWARYRPEDLATPEAFLANPPLVWAWYAWRRKLAGDVKPNPGHAALAEMEARLVGRGARFTLITQNVDGLHQRAGSRNVIELHGNIGRVRCFDEGFLVDATLVDTDGTAPASASVAPPRCPRCGGLLRPDVVWFGEMLPAAALQAAYEAAAACEVFLSIGTSALVQPAASLPLLAVQAQALLVEINPQETPLTASAAYFLQGKSGEVLPRLLASASLG
ncbi:MAG: SIR2 family NAD-dependent protein deacylase [Chloroflexota bacterium]